MKPNIKPTAKPKPAEGTPAAGIWKGHVVVPAIGGGWLRREVHLPSTVVDAYAQDAHKPCDAREIIVEQVDRWMRDPDLVSKFLRVAK